MFSGTINIKEVEDLKSSSFEDGSGEDASVAYSRVTDERGVFVYLIIFSLILGLSRT